ncbi:hypothetical protein PP175_26550 (plasmid) [Aneurinibacillus sp. Ricciae_BoGa-3]|uniref:hypothetical protein n=1 Tax=Aneurinibacillus sp. Ricciae_BoGa-3 TaxID=3022697 RepID=UPI0023400CCA|nr:hypothetical protein [Aneurinibacillus sp. Ricciae_BoGa-3]WCK57626.1 hypothetical protein PP175_26550 [Aneurinibacillus sp. Ricciae_BoGa-3]
MNKINQKGMELIQYKVELEKEYPKLIKDSLILSLEQMMENKVLDMNTYMCIKDEAMKIDEFQAYLLTKPAFTKSKEEIFAEYEILRTEVDKKLEEHEINHLKTESELDKEAILLTRRFCLDGEFTMSYFDVKEEDLLNLMKKRGFVEKFAVLRLGAIFNQLKEMLTYPQELFEYQSGLVYFDRDENGYCIDFTFQIKIEEVEKQERLDVICEGIKEVKKEVEDFYQLKMAI